MLRLFKLHWNRAAGPAEVLQLALPLVISTVSWTLMQFIDRMFLLWYSTESVAAAMPAGMTHFAIVTFPLGLATYTNAFVAQYFGAGQHQRIGLAVWQGVWLALLATPIFCLSYPFAPYLFQLVGHDESMIPLEVTYFLQLFIEMSAFTAFILLVGRVSKEAMVATTLAFNVNMIAFVPMIGLGIATSTIVGQKLGENRPALAARATWSAFAMAMVYGSIMAMMYLAAPGLFLMGWILMLGVVYWVRFLGGSWKQMRVIEPELVDSAELACAAA